MKARILVIDDDPDIVTLVRYNLEKEGYGVSSAASGEEGLSLVRQQAPDLILLDLMLPELDGLEVCQQLKRDPKTESIPVVMLTAKSEEPDVVSGLALGADDYVTKPFSPKVLVARVKAVLRRRRPAGEGAGILRLGTLEVDFERYTAKLNGRDVSLTAKEFELLKILTRAKGRVLTREYLLEQVWGYDRSLEIETRTVDVHVGQLRKKLGAEACRIVTVKNVGYRYDVDME